MKHGIIRSLSILALASASILPAAQAAEDEVYLFTSFRGNGQDGLHLAYSEDGLNWTRLNRGKPLLRPYVGKDNLMRDPCVIRGPDGKFHMVWTVSWWDKGIGIAHSEDLINWSEQKFIPVMTHEPKARNTWAPEITWDPDGEQYIIYWATTIPGRYPETDKKGDKGLNHRMYYTTTKDFKTYTPTEVLYDPGFSVIDSTILPQKVNGNYLMVTKDETRHPAQKNLHLSTADRMTGPWTKSSEPFTQKWVEGPTVGKIGDDYYVYYDCYTKHHYGVRRTKDWKNWEDLTGQLNMPKGSRHGTFIAVERKILDKLLELGPKMNFPVKASFTGGIDTVSALSDDQEPKRSFDNSLDRHTFHPHKGSNEWYEASFKKPRKVSNVGIYWYDDTGKGEVRVPESWKLLYKDGNQWKPVQTRDSFGTETDRYNSVAITPVTTSGLRIELKLQDGFSAGALEWKVE